MFKKKYFFLLLSVFICSMFIYILRTCRLEDGLDSSWQYALNYASSNHLNYGNDIIFTYGPLGFVGYVVFTGLSTGLLLFSVLIRFIFLVYFFLFIYEVAENISANLSKGVTIFVKYILLPFIFYQFGRLDFTTIIFSCLLHLYTINILDVSTPILGEFFFKRKALLTIFTGFTTAMMFFIKVSFFPFLIMLPLLLIIKFLFTKNFKGILLWAIAAGLTFFITFYSFNITLKSYIVNTLDIIDGYRKDMQMNYLDYYIYSYILSVILICVYLSQLWFLRKSITKTNILVLPIIFMGIYYLFIYSYTRGWDGGFIYNPPLVTLFFYLATYLITELKLRQRFANIIILVMLITLCNFGVKNLLKLKIDVFQILSARHSPHFVLPEKYIKKDQTYDVYPWNASYTYFNHLHYAPHPTIQSYADYTPSLDSLSAIFFNTQKVQNILFHGSVHNEPYTNSNDYKYFMFDEPLTKMAILKNYAVTDIVNDSFFIASKRAKPLQLQLKEIKRFPSSLGSEIDVAALNTANTVLYFTAGFKYASYVKLQSLFMRMPNIKMDITLANGAMHSFNIISDFIRNPCILNKYCENNRDFFNLVNTSTDTTHNIKLIKFYTVTGGYVNNFEMKVYTLTKL